MTLAAASSAADGSFLPAPSVKRRREQEGHKMHPLQNLFDNNRKWARQMRAQDPDFFARLAQQQRPQYLWIGCSDSRVPANQIIGLPPGEVFVHRNVANLVVHDDLNCLSVIQYAVEILQVRHIIVCGHYGCGGVAAALANQPLGLIDAWLEHIKDVERKSRDKLHTHDDEQKRVDRLCELNVVEQVRNMSETTMVRDAWRKGQPLTVNGLIYRISDGELRDLGLCATGPNDVPRS